jgi:phosphoribosylformylglycinamidine synthase
MGEFVECVKGIGEASKYLEFPVVSGNVSFYNQTKEVGIKPTPSIGGVGLIKNYKKMITMDFKEINMNEGDWLILARTNRGTY